VTVDALVKQAVSHAAAGPTSSRRRHDGRPIGAVRDALGGAGTYTPESSPIPQVRVELLWPVPRPVGSARNLGKGNKYNYQMDPANSTRRCAKCSFDLDEGADMVMIKPGCPTWTSCAA